VKAHEHHRLCRDLAGTDWRVGQPKRLSILVALEHHGQLTFSGLGRVTDISPGNLAAHLGQLEGFGYVTIARDELVVGPAMRTTATLTQPGITALEWHVENRKVLGIRFVARSSERTR
jgi:DNA-binding MarR family transcriptional regulator